MVSQEQKRNFLSKLEEKMEETIELNKIDDLEDFDAGLYITNLFNSLYEESFSDLDEEDSKILRARLWTDAYCPDTIKRYEDFILRQQDEE